MNFAPDTLSLLFIGLMAVLVAWGFLFGILPTALYLGGLHNARLNLKEIETIQARSPWIAVQQFSYFFRQKTLDALFDKYKEKVQTQEENGGFISDIEDYINEETLALRSWQGVVVQIPGSLTALGLLGTFIGLIIGISGIGFSSVEAAVSSIELLLNGVNTAFYTSIVGVIFSVLFNLLYRLEWNYMLRELGLFVEEFHMNVLPTLEEQQREKADQDMKLILERLDRLPKDSGYALAAKNLEAVMSQDNEKRLMPEVRKGLMEGEFSFQIRPKCDLLTGRVSGGETLICWTRGDMGVISPTTYLPVLEGNGYIATVDKYIWEEVCKTLRSWMDRGMHPLPLAVNISKTDILAMNIVDVFSELVHRYHIPPQYLELEIAENAFLQCESIVHEASAELRQKGFRIILDSFNGDFVGLSTVSIDEVDAIKLDLRYVNVDKKQMNSEMLQIYENAVKLRFPITVSGVETAEQLTLLRQIGFTVGQGSYLKPKLMPHEFEQYTGYGQ